MSKSSVGSPLIFDSFKIDRISLEMKPNIELLSFKGMLNPEDWEIEVEIRLPTYFKSRSEYVGGLQLKMSLLPGEAKKAQDKAAVALVSMFASIVGLFRLEDGQLDSETEQKLVTTHIPAVLMPHLRAAMTSTFASAGFGTVMIPLVNMHTVASNVADQIKVQVVP